MNEEVYLYSPEEVPAFLKFFATIDENSDGKLYQSELLSFIFRKANENGEFNKTSASELYRKLHLPLSALCLDPNFRLDASLPSISLDLTVNQLYFANIIHE